MATIVTRATEATAKGSPLTNSELGKMIINNGIEQTYIFRGTAIPEGWTKGRASKDRK